MTFAEQARVRLGTYPDGSPAGDDWWCQCVEGAGYDAEATEYADHERTQCAVYVDGSSLEFDGQHFVVFPPEEGHAVSGDGVHAARWNGAKWIIFEIPE